MSAFRPQDQRGPQRQAVISTRRLWKFFGSEVVRDLRHIGASATFDDLDRLPYIAGVRELDLDVLDGEVFVVMGLSGSGKSTLIRCLTGLLDASFGEIFVDGFKLSHSSKQELMRLRREKMGMVFQNFALLPHLTALENVAFPLRVKGAGAQERRRRSQEMLSLVGLPDMEDRYPSELSGGQQQRIGIARSLAGNPHLWFLDEPFSALDPLIRFDMQTELIRLQRLLQKTIVFITHDFDEAVRIADRIAIMRDGRLIQIGTAEELVLNPADAEVARFVERIPKHKVLRARCFCHASNLPMPADGPSISADATIAEAFGMVVETLLPIRVVDADGRTLGSLCRDKIVKVMRE